MCHCRPNSTTVPCCGPSCCGIETGCDWCRSPGETVIELPKPAPMDVRQRETVERILRAWLKMPELRFGQFLINATRKPIYYVRDGELADDCEEYVK